MATASEGGKLPPRRKVFGSRYSVSNDRLLEPAIERLGCRIPLAGSLFPPGLAALGASGRSNDSVLTRFAFHDPR